MKTFKQFLTEADIQDFEDFIIQHCHWLLSALDADVEELDNLPLYRGMGHPSGRPIKLLKDGKQVVGHIQDVRKNRIPLDTHLDLSEVMDDFFKHEFGWKPRGTTVFAYGKHGKNDAGQYGDLYRIYPMGKFRFLWGEVNDLTARIRAVLMRHGIPYKALEARYNSEELADAYEAFYEAFKGKYHDTDLRAAITGAPREIMIDCNQYLAIRA